MFPRRHDINVALATGGDLAQAVTSVRDTRGRRVAARFICPPWPQSDPEHGTLRPEPGPCSVRVHPGPKWGRSDRTPGELPLRIPRSDLPRQSPEERPGPIKRRSSRSQADGR